MSIEAVGRVLSAPIGGNCKVVLLGIANHAHRDGTNAYPSIETLALYAYCDRRTAQRNVRKLEEDGYLEREGVGPMGQTRWRIVFARCDEGGGKMPQGGASVPGGAALAPPEPSIEPSTSLSTEKETLAEPQTSDGSFGELLVAREGENGSQPRVKHNGREVPRMLVQEATQALEHFNATTGRKCQPFTGRGKPSESLSRIVGAMLDWPAVRVEWRRMIDRSLADPWWDGPASTGVIFGPKVVEASLARATMPQRQAPSLRGLTPSGRAVAKLLAANGDVR